MRQSALFTKTRREAPADEASKNAQLLIRAGFVHKEMAGVYSFLPLGLRVLERIIAIIREEMNAIGGEEVLLTTLQDPAPWKASGRWDDKAVDVWFKTKLKNGGELGLANTHEEAVTALMREHIASYKDLPRAVYQFQNKFRNETRAKSGILRAREFIMKDLYSFSRSEAQFRDFYERAAAAYLKIFERAGVGNKTFRTFASGGSFSKFSDEFQTECTAGEDTIYIHDEKRIAVNEEVYTDAVLAELGLAKGELRQAKAIEVGNIFPLGSKYSAALGLVYKDEAGKQESVIMGSYGIGPGRLMGTVAEVMSDEKGLVWPESIAPFVVHLVNVLPGDPKASAFADALYTDLARAGVEVLYDDRAARAGEKLADADLIGIPARVVVGKNALASGKVESTYRSTGQTRAISREDLLSFAASAQEQHRRHA